MARSYAPNDAQELGASMAALRGRVSLRKLEARQVSGPGLLVLSKTTLHRYERGEVLPPLNYAAHLDDLYNAEGWLEMSISSLWRPRWNPWTEDHGTASRLHAGRWPAPQQGPVWVKSECSSGEEARSGLKMGGPVARRRRCSLVP